MHLSEYLSPETILVDASCTDKWDLLSQLVSRVTQSKLYQLQSDLSEETVRNAIFARERERSTGVGHGMAFSHARLADFYGLVLGVALPSKPVEFGSLDHAPVSAVLMILTPKDSPSLALRILSQLALLFSRPSARQALLEAKSPQGVYDVIAANEPSIDRPLLARDIMRQPLLHILPTTPLRDIARGMLQYRLDAVGVVESDNTLVGEITTDNVFRAGLPDFLLQLKSVSFIRKFDPFEHYFRNEAKAHASDVMSSSFSSVSEDATLLEVVFELAVQGRPKVYVTRDGKRTAVIDRVSVLDHVLNF